MSDDPWERREREKSKRREAQRQRTDWDLFTWISDNARALLVLLSVALLLSAEIPTLGGPLRGFLAIGGTALLLVVAAMLRTWQRSAREILAQPPTLAGLALVAWCAVAFVLSPYRPQAGAEFLRIVAGATVYALAAHGLSASERNTVVGGVLTLGCGLSLVDFVRMSQLQNLSKMVRGISQDYSIFGTHENIGSLLALLVPVVAALALTRTLEEKRRWAAQAATLILTFAWLAARCRSAWIGGGVALVVLALLLWRSPTTERSRPRNARERFRELLGSPLPVLVGAMLVMAIGGGFATFFSQRAATVVNVMDDGSLTTRITMWEGAAQMAAQKPLVGWGLGSYPVLQGWWTHLGAEPEEVLQSGATHANIAHNYYFQWAAEAGGIGLALHVTMLLLWLLATLRALGRPLAPLDRAVALGGAAAVFGAGVDALASPAYQFHGVYTVLWLLMGLASAATALRTGEAAPRDRNLPLVAASVALGIGLAALVPLWGKRLGASPTDSPRGTFILLSNHEGPSVSPGTSVTIRAQFTDGRGKRANTSPGTTWELPSERESGALNGGIGQLIPEPGAETQAAIRVTLPDKPGGIVQIMARFNDRAGRGYIASQIFLLKKEPTK